MTEESCNRITEMLVDYADGLLSQCKSREVAEHVAECESCRSMLHALRKSLELAQVLWQDGLDQIGAGRVSDRRKIGGRHWFRYAAVAAGIATVMGAFSLWRALTQPALREPTFAEVQRRVTEAGEAARLLASAEMLARYAGTKASAERQYRYIVQEYPRTAAATQAKLRIR